MTTKNEQDLYKRKPYSNVLMRKSKEKETFEPLINDGTKVYNTPQEDPQEDPQEEIISKQDIYLLQIRLIESEKRFEILESENKELASDLEGYKTLYRSTETERRLLEDKIKTMKTVINAL